MNLYLLEPYHSNEGPWEKSYDVAEGFVVRAHTEKEARVLCGTAAGDENTLKTNNWENEKLVQCTLINEGVPQIILCSWRSA